MGKKLTGNRELFAKYVASGLSQSDAYRKAYDCKKSTDKTIHENASRLMADSKVIARVKELSDKADEKLIDSIAYSKEDSFKQLEKAQGIALKCVKKAFHNGKCVDESSAPDLNNFIRAEELKGKLFGLYVEKSEVTAKGINVVVADKEKAETVNKI